MSADALRIVAFSASALGLVLGALLGLMALLRPRYAARQMGMSVEGEVPGGIGEERAFGGLLLGLHALPLVGVAFAILEAQGKEIGPPLMGLLGFLVCAPVAFGWLCAAIARTVSVFADRQGVAMNARYIALDVLLAFLIGAPALLLLLR